MKKRLTFITLLMLLCSVSFGQNWEVLDYNYSNTMELIATVTVQSEAVESIEVAAFDEDGNVRGVAFNTYDEDFDKYILNMTIHGTDNYKLLSFKAYDHNKEVLLFSDTHFDFIINDTQGSWNAPLEMDFYSVHWNESDIVYTETSMTITSIVHIDDVYQDRSYLEVAAFCGSELRGIGRTSYDEYYDKYVAYIFVSGNNNEDISFKLYDHSNENATELISINTVNFITDENLGYDTPISIYFTNPIAKIGAVYYNTLAAAVEAAEGNDVITLLKSAEGSGVVINKNVTIDFGGFTYTFADGPVGSTGTESNGFQILNGNTVTLQNGTLNVAEAYKGDYYMLIQNYANLNVTEMTLDGTNLDKWIADYSDSYVLSNNSGNVNITKSTIIANSEGSKSFAFDVYKNPSYAAPVVTLDATSTISGIVELSGGELYTSQEIDIVVEKEFKAGADWGTISVPVVDALIPEATAGIHDLYRYDEPSATWQYYKDGVNGGNAENPFATLKLGQGYLYANAADIELVLEGKLNSADVVFPLSYTEGNNLAGFNMVGNPFAYSIGLGNFATEASLADGFYTIGAGGAWIAQTEGQKIAPMEAVLVKADKAANMTIKAGQQQGTKRNQPKAYLAINVANSEFEDVAYVSFSEGMGLDKISHRNADVPMVSVPVDGKEYAIAIMNEDVTEIPVTFKASTIGEYTFSAEGIECEFSKLTLVDRQTGNTANLLLEDYTFMATSNDNANRFFLQIDNSQESTDSSIFAYINNGMIKIDNVEGNGVVIVLDVLGRPVAEYDVQESANIPTASFRSGVYMIQMMDNNGVKVQKIIID